MKERLLRICEDRNNAMSYCVHCGVQIADYEKSCPLCGTPVIDPQRTMQGEPLFIDRMDLTAHRINRTFVATLVFAVMLIPFAITAILDFILSVQLTWAFYVLGAEGCFGIFFLVPFLYPRANPYWFALTDTAAAAAYLLLIAALNHGISWYFVLGLPLVLLTGWFAVLCLFFVRQKKLGKLGIAGRLLLSTAIFLFGIDIIIRQALAGSFWPLWAWYASAPLIVLGVVIIIFSRSIRISEWIRRKLFL